ncbi:MAG: hypothetical protein O7F16_13105 [Acidobacteria bacterium]|nr:hypothetical protein [Acidobacteriota bacterium]
MLLLLLAGLISGLASAPHGRAEVPLAVLPEKIEPLIDGIVAAVHEGDYVAARQLLDDAYALSPSDPGVFWSHAFLLVWESAYRLDEVAADAAFVALLDAIQAHHQRVGRGSSNEPRAAYYYGLASLMRARTRIEGPDKELFKAAADARRGIRSLERAVKLGYNTPDASFWIGAYRIMAGSAPAALRAVRFLIGMPSASRKKGLRELDHAVLEGRRFRLESSLMMAGVLAGDRKQGYEPALALMSSILPDLTRRGSILPGYAGKLLAGWGLNRPAMSLWRRILDRRAVRPELYNDLETATVHYSMARLLVEEFRWAEAIPHLKRILEGPELQAPRLSQRARLLLARCYQRLGDRSQVVRLLEQFSGSGKTRKRLANLMAASYPDPVVEREVSMALKYWNSGGAVVALAALEDLLLRRPTHAAARYHAGRAAFRLHRLERAEHHFRMLLGLDRQSALSETLLGWNHLYLGWLADLKGAREEALIHYKKVQKMKSFDAYRAGELYAQMPYSRVSSGSVGGWVPPGGEAPWSGQDTVERKAVTSSDGEVADQ